MVEIKPVPEGGWKIELDEEYFRKRFSEVFDRWGHELDIGMLKEDKENMLEQLVACLNGEPNVN